jgi:hypothetical protein
MTTDAPHPKIARLIAYWQSLAPAPGLLPGRRHFDPVAVPELLPHVWLIDVEPGPPLRFRYRLIGTALIEAGAPMRKGDYFDEVRNQPARDEVTDMLEAVVRERQPNWRRGAPKVAHAKHVSQLERIVLPLASDGQTVDILLGMTLFYWDDGRVY